MDKILKLKTLLQTEAYNGLTAEEQLALVNTRDKAFNVSLNSRSLLIWSAADGRAARLKRAANNDTLPEEVQSIAFAAFKMLERSDVTLDLDDVQMIAFIDGLIAAGILTAQDKTDLLAMSAVTGSDAEKERIVEFGNDVYLTHINQARTLLGQ